MCDSNLFWRAVLSTTLISFMLPINGHIASPRNISIIDSNNPWNPISIGTTWSNAQIQTPLASSIVDQPVYVSITSVSHRVRGIPQLIKRLLSGTILPTHIFVILSEEPYLLDDGVPVQHIPKDLLNLSLRYPVSIIYSSNVGPHRKLLPLLYHKENEDCVIITLDDDITHSPSVYTVIEELVTRYNQSNRESIVAIQAKRIGYCLRNTSVTSLAPYKQWELASPGSHEMLLLPIGNGGVLYRPKFFDKIVFDANLRLITNTNDDLTFRLATLVHKVKVLVGCGRRSVWRQGKCKARARRLVSKKAKELWRLNCNQSRNDAMLPAAMHYLQQTIAFNMMDMSQEYLHKERQECLSVSTQHHDQLKCSVDFNCKLQ